MTKKYVLTGAIAAFLSAASLVHAPTRAPVYFRPAENTIRTGIEDFLEKHRKENEEIYKQLIKKFDDIKNYRTDDFRKDSLELLTARLMMGEDEDNPKICKIADTWTVLNRLKIGGWYGETFHEVVLKPKQYSCFNEGTDSSIYLKIPLQHNVRDFLINLKLSEEFWSGKYPDPTNGATHYYNPKRVKKPSWVNGMIFCGKIGNHLYYKKK